MVATHFSTNAEALKTQTARAHGLAEERLMTRLTAIQSLPDYAAILKMFYGFFQPMERLLHEHITVDVLPDMAERRSALHLVEDLKALDVDVTGVAVCESLPNLKSVAEAMGAIYVLEGSTLGGRVIAKMLAKNTAVTIPSTALHFFNGYGEETGSKWKAFIQAVNHQSNATAMTKSANETFHCLGNWMKQCFGDASFFNPKSLQDGVIKLKA